jgi:hypothetical protein
MVDSHEDPDLHPKAASVSSLDTDIGRSTHGIMIDDVVRIALVDIPGGRLATY